jgi:hypothetical protein
VPDEPYRAPLPIRPDLPDPYTVAWKSLRRRRRRAWVATAILVATFLWIGSSDTGGPGVVAISIVFVPCMLFWRHAAAFVCPHCGKPFVRKPPLHQAFGRQPRFRNILRCAHCDIMRGTPKSAVDEAGKRAADVTAAGA